MQEPKLRTVVTFTAIALTLPLLTTNTLAQSYYSGSSYHTVDQEALKNCKRNEDTRQFIGAGLGAVAGGYAGSQLFKGEKEAGIAGGAIVGGLIGNGIADKSIDCDPVYTGGSTYTSPTYTSGTTYTTTSPTYSSGTYTTGSSYYQPSSYPTGTTYSGGSTYGERVVVSNHPVYSNPSYGASSYSSYNSYSQPATYTSTSTYTQPSYSSSSYTYSQPVSSYTSTGAHYHGGNACYGSH